MSELQLTMRAAAYHYDLFPRASVWLDQLNAATAEEDFYPATLPPGKVAPGSIASDTGILGAHILWSMSGDRSLLKENWKTMNKYLTARKKVDPKFVGRPFGELPPGIIPEGDPTPEALVHSASHGLLYRIMSELSRVAAETPFEKPLLEKGYQDLRTEFGKRYLDDKKRLKIDSLLAQLVTLRYGLLATTEEKEAVSAQFIEKFKREDKAKAFSHGPLGAYALLPVLTWTDNHDLALEVVSSQSVEDLSPVALATISEWLIWMVAGIDPVGPGFQFVRFAPRIPSSDSLSFAKASYQSHFGEVASHWYLEDDAIHYKVTLPANIYGSVVLPARDASKVKESGKSLDDVPEIVQRVQEEDQLVLTVLPGKYHFVVSK